MGFPISRWIAIKFALNLCGQFERWCSHSCFINVHAELFIVSIRYESSIFSVRVGARFREIYFSLTDGIVVDMEVVLEFVHTKGSLEIGLGRFAHFAHNTTINCRKDQRAHFGAFEVHIRVISRQPHFVCTWVLANLPQTK